MKKTLLWLWQLPQHLLGIAYKLYLQLTGGLICKFPVVNTGKIDSTVVYEKKTANSVSLGEYIFVNDGASIGTIRHEHGHTQQSRILGPLYLLVIGIPSIVHAALHDKCCKNNNYHHFYTEKWANKLAGLK